MPKADFQPARQAMIDSQLRTSGVNERWVLEAMDRVAREEFVPKERAGICYMDRSVPVGESRYLNPALATGMMMEAAKPLESDNTLLVGAATGYVAALLAPMVDSVVATERKGRLATAARKRLADFSNLKLQTVSNLSEGYAKNAPYSLLWIDGGIEQLPASLKDQIADGGRIVAGLKEGPVSRLAFGVKRGDELALRPFADVEIAPLSDFEKTREFAF